MECLPRRCDGWSAAACQAFSVVRTGPQAGTIAANLSEPVRLAAPFESAIGECISGLAQTQPDDVEPSQELAAFERLIVERRVEQLG